MSHAAFDIDELEALANAATPGPWERYNPCDEDCKDCRSTEYVHGAQDAIIRKGHRFDGEIITCDSGAYGPKLADANFIVTARIAVPALIVALRAARKDSVRQAQQAIEWSKIAGSYIAKPDKARATVSNGLELAKVYQAMDNGFDDSRWPPGLTAVDALIRERDDALRDARAMDEAHCAAIKRAEVAEKELAKYKEIATSQHYAFNAERDGLRLRVDAAELQSAASVAGNVELGSLVLKYQADIRELRAENEQLRAALRGVVRVADRDTDEFNAARAALSPQAEASTCEQCGEVNCRYDHIKPFEDSTPWCTGCGALQKSQCDCGPRAENE